MARRKYYLNAISGVESEIICGVIFHTEFLNYCIAPAVGTCSRRVGASERDWHLYDPPAPRGLVIPLTA